MSLSGIHQAARPKVKYLPSYDRDKFQNTFKPSDALILKRICFSIYGGGLATDGQLLRVGFG